MIKVGITGGIGSGKSYIVEMIRHLAVPVYLSDERAKELMNSNEEIRMKISTLFGEKAYVNDELNRAYLAQQIFSDPFKRKEMNAIVHPVVKQDFKYWMDQLPQKTNYCIKEAAILIETEGYKELDELIVVTAPLKLRKRRVLERDSGSVEDFEKRVAAQITDEERLRYASFRINNNETAGLLFRVLSIHEDIIKKYENSNK